MEFSISAVAVKEVAKSVHCGLPRLHAALVGEPFFESRIRFDVRNEPFPRRDLKAVRFVQQLQQRPRSWIESEA
jgi:hypothetical protein